MPKMGQMFCFRWKINFSAVILHLVCLMLCLDSAMCSRPKIVMLFTCHDQRQFFSSCSKYNSFLYSIFGFASLLYQKCSYTFSLSWQVVVIDDSLLWYIMWIILSFMLESWNWTTCRLVIFLLKSLPTKEQSQPIFIWRKQK